MSETIVVKEESGGMKGDGGKRDWSLADFEFLDRVVDVLTFGAKKYTPNNWQRVSKHRYQAAIYRHLSLYVQGEMNDEETGLPHLAHVACSAMFLHWLDKDAAK